MTIPLSLYVHLPWCVKKCPYCDFNSHEANMPIPEMEYVKKLLQDLDNELASVADRSIQSIFFGGGTPSLFSAPALGYLLEQVRGKLRYAPDIEVTLEANPGAIEQAKFTAFRKIGINRLSIGIQSFQKEKLHTLGRIHNDKEAEEAVIAAKAAGFTNFNLDLMFGLPNQSVGDALYDLNKAISYLPSHISWYQLTIEPHTRFYQFPPKLPDDEQIWQMQQEGQAILAANYYQQYEVSAYSQPGQQCWHNRNYWEFGDYIGIGAGAHSKITHAEQGEIIRTWKIKHPKHYLQSNEFIAGRKKLSLEELPLEFMLNALRLWQPISFSLFQERTGLALETLRDFFVQAQRNGLLLVGEDNFSTTAHGKRFLNDLLSLI